MFNLEELYKKEAIKESPVLGQLYYIRYVLDFFYFNKLANILTHFSHISLLGWTLLEVIYFFLFPSGQFLLDFGYSFFAILYVFVVITINYILRPYMNEMDSFMEDNFWNLRCCGSELYENLSKRAVVPQVIGWIQFIIALINALLFLPLESEHLKLFFVLSFLKSSYESVYQYYRYVFFTLLSWGTMIVLLQYNIYVYYIAHMDLQYQLLIAHVENIETDIENGLIKRSYDEEIGRRLAMCVAHFQNLTEFRQQFSNLLHKSSLLAWLGLGVSMFLAYHILVMKTYESIFALSALWFSVAESTMLSSLLGQQYIDIAEDIYSALTRCLWYNWSIPNIKSYLIFLKYTQDYKIVLFNGIIPFNLTLAIWMGRKTASALTFFRTVKRVENNKA